MIAQQKQYVTRAEAAKLLNVSPRTVSRYAEKGLLRQVKVAGGTYARGYYIDDVQALFEIVEISQAARAEKLKKLRWILGDTLG